MMTWRWAVFCMWGLTLCSDLCGATVEGHLRVLQKGGGAALDDFSNAVVYLSGVETSTPDVPVESGQINKQFKSRIIIAVAGQRIDFWNHDRVRHNVFSNDPRNTFDLKTYPKGEFRSAIYSEVGKYKVYCNIHPQMICDVVIVPNRYFGETASDGSFRIEGVPEGRYTLHAWHIYGGELEQPIELGSDDLAMDLEVTSKYVLRELERHKDKRSKAYKKRGY